MSPQRASYTCTALRGTNKVGVLRPDASGYYTLVLGALNIFNSGKAFYPYETAKELFKESSSLMRRISNGALRGEYGHPRQQPGQSLRDFMGRVLDIYEPNVCCHIRKVTLDASGKYKDEEGRSVIAVIGEIKPSGPMGPALEASLQNPDENVCFSIRSITNDQQIRGVTHKNLKTIVTWDYVNEPGLSVAKKWYSPALESLPVDDIGAEECELVPMQLLALRAEQSRMRLHGMESSSQVSIESVLEDLGWVEQSCKDALPASARW